jgi:SPP1 family phage portal protein
MFYLNRNKEITVELLQKMIERFRLNVEPTLNKYSNYYDGKQAILNKSYSDASKPCSRTVINYCKNIVDSYCGYLATPGYITYKNEDSIDDSWMDVLKYNDYTAEDSEFLQQALTYGVAAELMYIDENSNVRFKLINPATCFGVYDDSLTNDLLYFVRMYKANEWDDSDTYYIDVYGASSVKHYTMEGKDGTPALLGEEQHYFNQCPANIFYLQGEKSVFDCVLGL